MTFEEASLIPRSEKVTLVTLESAKQARIFTLQSGSTYIRDVDFYVERVKEGSISLTKALSVGLMVAGSFYYDITTKILYLRTTDDTDPKNKEIIIFSKHFFSNAPLILPNDLLSGQSVEFLPYIESISSIGQQLDDENTGIVLESNSSISLINNHGYFDEIFDTEIFENKSVSFYTWFPQTPISEARKIFTGVIESKDFESNRVTFKVKDFVFRLRDFVNLQNFSSLDGKLSPSLIDTPKRRIYGQVKQVQLAGVDNVLDGFTATGTVSAVVDTNVMSGTGTLFLSELSVGDELIFNVAGQDYKFGVEQINSDIELILNKDSDVNIVNKELTVLPIVPYRAYNRIWHLAGHKLREPTTTITSVIANNRFEVASTEDIFSGEQVLINGDLVTIRRISGNEIVTQSAVSPLPTIGDTFKKLPIQNVFFGSKELIYSRDWDYTNTTEAKIQINDLAEFNITQEKSLGVSVTFTNSSRTISTSQVADFRSILKPRDWIRKNSTLSGENDWYEILDVKEQSITLRTPFTGSTQTTTSLIKSVTHIDDSSLITANCLGMESEGKWIKRPSDAVRHLVLNDAEFPSVNETSFNRSAADCDYILSIVIPENLQSEPPAVRDVITKINESCFGSLYGDSTLNISYSILNSEKPEISNIIKDDDILSFSAESNTEIYNKIQVFYRPFIDIFNQQPTFESLTFDNVFVDKYVGIKNKLDKTIYLYEDDKALIIAQRYGLFKSLTNTKISIKGKMLFFLNAVNDKVFLNLDRLYKRFGGEDRRKIGIITGIKKSQTEVDLTFSDMGNIFNRVPSIAPNTANDFLLASDDETVSWGYIVDDAVLTPDPTSERFSNCNIVG
jgi:hypothetical protein